MSEILSQLWTPEMQAVVIFFIVLLVAVYVLSVIWVVRDAYQRGTLWYAWAVAALVPIIGVIAYCLLRPPLLQIDRDEQELEIALKQRQLMHYGECGNCGYPVEADYVLCPNCHQRLKNQCAKCGHALDPSWTLCPYCATPLPGTAARQSARTTGRPHQQAAPQANKASAPQPQQDAMRPLQMQEEKKEEE